MTTGSPASSTLTTEFVVPKSIPTALGISSSVQGFWALPNWVAPVTLTGSSDVVQYSKLECPCIKSFIKLTVEQVISGV
jgi:hypothetical protein